MKKILTIENFTSISKDGYERPLMVFENISLFCQ